MNVKQILKILPSELFSVLSQKYNIDYKAKKLKGETIFKVLLYSMFSEKNYSLYKLKETFDNTTFQKKYLNNEEITSIDKTSFHYRLNNIDSKFFEDIFKKTLEKAKNLSAIKKDRSYNLLIFDSTLVNLSSKLLKDIGYSFGGNNSTKSKIKYVFGLSEFPEIIKVHGYNNENKSLKEAINSQKIEKNRIILFDQGISDRSILEKIGEKNYFITRIKKDYKIEKEKEESIKKETETLRLTKEVIGKLYSNRQVLKSSFRLIHGYPKTSNWDIRKNKLLRTKKTYQSHKTKPKEELKEEILNKELVFITNIPKAYINSEEITELYRKRWQIELFFKLIKQELHFSHLLNRTENGIRVMLYVTMIFVVLLMLYKSKNNLRGYKYVKSKLLLELQEEFYDYVVEISGGSKQKWRNTVGNPFF